MALKIANIDINKGYLGDLELSVAYLGAIEASFIKSDFIISVKTDNLGTSADNEFTLPWIGTYDVDWGDGVVENGVVDTQTHTYASAGTYDVKVKAATGQIFFARGNNDRKKLLDIKNWGTCAWATMYKAFSGCELLEGVSAMDIPNFTNCTNTSSMFANSVYNTSGKIPNLANWDVSNVTNMGGVLQYLLLQHHIFFCLQILIYIYIL